MSEEVKTRGTRKERQGFVVSRSGNKSVVVAVERRFRHPVYGKVITNTRKYHVHDEENKVKIGDKVVIVEARPISRTKRWRVVEITGGAQETGRG